jgi:endonuclease/exonuclease/phosphatase family metal-dependent hydrolase
VGERLNVNGPQRAADEEEHLSYVHAITRRLPLLAIAAALALAMLLPAAASAGGKHGDDHGKGHTPHGHHGHGHHGNGHHKGSEVDVMSRNLYLGAVLDPAVEAESPEELAEADGEILRQVVANDFPTRAKGLANEILRTNPDLVGLQEVALWQSTPLSPTATPVNYDYLELLLNRLNKGPGTPYRVVEVQQEFDLEAPADMNEVAGDGPLPGFPTAELVGHLTMRDVILAHNGVHTWGAEGANFNTLLELPILGQPTPIARGWTATDARVRGSGPFRFVNTHLESFHPLIRQAQADELVAPGGPATSDLPVVLVGDLNSDDDTVTGADTFAYNDLLAAGMVERSTDDPLSCCLNSALLSVGGGGSVADFDHQVDHVMTRNPDEITLKYSLVTGLNPVNGFWDSDHAGLFSALRFDD